VRAAWKQAFQTLALTTLNDRKGIFAVISGTEDRSQQLRPMNSRKSVLGKLETMKASAPAQDAPAPKKQRGAER